MSDALPRDARIYVAGHRGMVGGAITRALQRRGYDNLLLRTHQELDLKDQAAVRAFFTREKPPAVVLAAAKVGGIQANNIYRADFIYDNLMIECNAIHEAHRAGVQRLLYLGSSCIYPKFAPQPIAESALLTGALEQTNQPYAIAKIAGIELCDAYNRQHGTDFRAAMPTNLYGPGDYFDLEKSHVIPALLRRFHEATQNQSPSVTCWGTGTPRREFLHVDDLAEACVFLLERSREQWRALETTHVNVGCGEDVTIRELVELVRQATGYRGEVKWDATKPDGTPRKLLDISLMRRLGWAPKVGLTDGLASTYRWFLQHHADARGLREQA
ncbi:MAG TPA: GDP-L-fucose synthase [Nevskiaceae bacterium]|nr:GDP-L-fucose synthase [Nevskiaceae bacterium]